MHIKIQGGGEGKYSNTGSCSSLISYLEHEDLERQTQGEKAGVDDINDYEIKKSYQLGDRKSVV